MGADSSLDETPGNVLNEALEMDSESKELVFLSSLLRLPRVRLLCVPLLVIFSCWIGP